jgi:hypothetical protein
MTTQTTRRAALVGAAALPVMSLPAIAETDPIFEKIAKYRAAWDALRGHTDEPVDANGRLDTESPLYKAWCNKEGELGELLSDAEYELVLTPPRTQSGAVAMIRTFLDVRRGTARTRRPSSFAACSAISTPTMQRVHTGYHKQSGPPWRTSGRRRPLGTAVAGRRSLSLYSMRFDAARSAHRPSTNIKGENRDPLRNDKAGPWRANDC